jgi:hypothetical protein
VKALPESEWVWCGYAGHFIAASSCRMHLHTRVGNYRISTVGDYRSELVWDRATRTHRPRQPDDPPDDIGSGRKYETFVFRVSGHGEHGEGTVDEWSEIWTEAYNEPTDAEMGHMDVCRRFARVAAGLEPEPSWEMA